MTPEERVWHEERADWHYRMAAYCLDTAAKENTGPAAWKAYVDDAQTHAREGRLHESLADGDVYLKASYSI